ncbi:hypothetical protein [Haloprofundus halobius]|uniref:hypothetical protein n=1 Tax=Haloprofundus halobius TaxID=2876194 RepID=UPI001CCE66D4|nr:hypothetical protein [Haloprofundus halobius]
MDGDETEPNRNVITVPEATRKLIYDYNRATSNSEKRDIENQVLEETVWRPEREADGGPFTLSRDDLMALYERLDDDDEEGKQLVRKALVDHLSPSVTFLRKLVDSEKPPSNSLSTH